MYKLLLFLSVLLYAGLASSVGHGPGQCSWPNCEKVFDVRDFGAVANATEATCGTENPPICTVAGTGTDDRAAIQAAVTAAGSATPAGEVWIPCGNYRVDSTIQILNDGVKIRGDGRCSVLMPGWTNGDTFFEVCGETACDSTTAIPDVEITGLTFLDDNPEASNHNGYVIVDEGTLAGGVPAPGDSVTWSAGAESGTVVRYDAVNGVIRIHEDTGDSLAEGDDVTNGVWTATDVSYATGACATLLDGCGVDTATGTKAIDVQRGVNIKIHDNYFIDIGEVAINIGAATGNESERVQVYDNYFDNCPALASKGSCIDIRSAHETHVNGNYFEAGVEAVYSTQWVIALVNQYDGADGTLIEDNIIHEDGTTIAQIEGGIGIGPNTANITNTTIQGNEIVVDSDTSASYHGSIAITTAANAVTDLHIEGNTLIGSVLLNGNASNTYSVVGNKISGTNGIGLEVADLSAHVEGNEISDFPDNGIFINTITNGNIVGNTVRDTTASGAAEGQIFVNASTTVTGTLKISGNQVEGIAAAAQVYGIDCNLEPDVVVSNNDVINSDHVAIRDCFSVIGNRITGATNAGIMVDGIAGATVSNNVIDGAGAECIYARNTTYSSFIGNVVGSCTSPQIHMLETTTSDYNLCMGNVNLDSAGGGAEIECGDTTSAGDDVGCADDGAAADNTYCGGNIQTP